MLRLDGRHICRILFIIAHFPLKKGETHTPHGEESASLLKMTKIHKHLHQGLYSCHNYMEGLSLYNFQLQGKVRPRCKCLLKSSLFHTVGYHGDRFPADTRMRGRACVSTGQKT